MIPKSKMKKKKVSKPVKQKAKPSLNKSKSKFGKQSSRKKSKLSSKNLNQPQVIQNEQQESDQGEDLLDMVEPSDLEFLRSAVLNRSYNILNKVKYADFAGPKPKRQKVKENDEELETEYEKVKHNEPETIKIARLPIKIKSTIIPQSITEELEYEEETVDDNDEESEEQREEVEKSPIASKPITAVQLIASRNQMLQDKKIEIGALSSSFLENPEEKIANLRILLNMLDEQMPEIHYTVKKLVLVSLLEIFKDIVPSYEIKSTVQEGVKLKKDTLKLQKYEESLILYYRKYLQKLEKFAYKLIRKQGKPKQSEEECKVSILAVQGMCDLLVTHPYFNFGSNIAQALVPIMNNRNKIVRDIIISSFKTVFKEDKKGVITLKILRLVNNFIKTHSNNVHTEILDILLVLNLKGVSLDQEKELDRKQKKLKAHKSRILQLSKKERKRKKKLKEVEKELLETKAEENRDMKMKNLTEITKLVFNIYFRILKSTENTKLLGACLEGLAKFAHYINLEFSLDIITVLENILNEKWLNPKEGLHCMQTVFAILSGQGEALNVDPTNFYNRLYSDLLTFNLSSKDDDLVFDLIKTLDTALIKRRKKITNKRTIGFTKRIATLCLQMIHNGSIGCLAIIKTIMTLNRYTDILLDTDASVGDGKFLADVNDPEYCNASNTALFEMVSLSRHYHPVVRNFASHIASGLAITGRGSLSGEYVKMPPEQLFEEFSMAEMAFNPAVPVPKIKEPKTQYSCRQFKNEDFHTECKDILKSCVYKNFFTEFIEIK